MSDFQKRRVTLVDTQVRPSDVTKFPIIDAMLSIRREEFVPDAKREAAYADAMIRLEGGRYLLDARTFAKMLDALNVQSNDMVLDIGCGLGYSSAVIGHYAEAVVAIEESGAMVQEAETRLAAEGIVNVAVLEGALTNGAQKHAPFDAIIIQGAVEEMPVTLTDQLAEGGRIAAIFDEGGQGAVRIGTKIDGRVSWRFACNATAPVLNGFSKELEFSL